MEAGRDLANELSIRSVPKLVRAAAEHRIPLTAAQAAEVLRTRVPRQILFPPPKALGKAYAESPQSRYSCDLIDFSQNTRDPQGLKYILVLMETWSRRIWAAATKDKRADTVRDAMRHLIGEVDFKSPEDGGAPSHDLIHDAGQEWTLLHEALPENFVQRTKDPRDRNGIATLDRGIQSLKKVLEDKIEQHGGSWPAQLEASVDAYNRSPQAAVLGAPETADQGGSRSFLIEDKMADAFAHNTKITGKRMAALEATKAYRAPTGAVRSFNPQYNVVEHLRSVTSYRVTSETGRHTLLKHAQPVPAESGEPQGRLTSQRQYKVDTLRPLADKLYKDLLKRPREVGALATVWHERLLEHNITVPTFVRLYPELMAIKDGVVYAKVLHGEEEGETAARESPPQPDDAPPLETPKTSRERLGEALAKRGHRTELIQFEDEDRLPSVCLKAAPGDELGVLVLRDWEGHLTEFGHLYNEFARTHGFARIEQATEPASGSAPAPRAIHPLTAYIRNYVPKHTAEERAAAQAEQRKHREAQGAAVSARKEERLRAAVEKELAKHQRAADKFFKR